MELIFHCRIWFGSSWHLQIHTSTHQAESAHTTPHISAPYLSITYRQKDWPIDQAAELLELVSPKISQDWELDSRPMASDGTAVSTAVILWVVPQGTVATKTGLQSRSRIWWRGGLSRSVVVFFWCHCFKSWSFAKACERLASVYQSSGRTTA